MPKSDWTNGTYLTPSFAQGYFGTSASTGHNHESLDDPDSAPKINLTNGVEVYGPLPLTNMVDGTNGPLMFRCEPPYSDIVTDTPGSFQRIGNQATVFFPTGIWGKSVANDQFQVVPASGTWPAEILPGNNKFPILFATKESLAAGLFRTGSLVISTGATDAWVGYIDSTSVLVSDDWGFGAATPKGFLGGSVTYGID